MGSQVANFEPSSGWEDDIDGKEKAAKLIDIANRSIKLEDVLREYNIELERTYSTSGWGYKGSCPFDDHNDRTPSFGYNPTTGVFNCFGCHRGGKAVEFIAYKENRSRIAVARQIIGNYSPDEVLLHNTEFDFEALQRILFDFADVVRAFTEQYNSQEAAKYARNVCWSLDVYLQKFAPNNAIRLEDLEARIALLKRQLDLYGDSE